MIMSETKLEKEEERNITGYKASFLNNETPAGGVMILVKENIRSNVIKKNKLNQTIWMEVKTIEGRINIIIGGIYGPCENITKKDQIKKSVKLQIQILKKLNKFVNQYLSLAN